MTEWHAEVTLTGDPTEDQLEELTDRLPGSGVITHYGGTGRFTVALLIQASTLQQATDSALRTARETAREVLGRAEMRSQRVLPIEDYQAEIERPALLDLVGSTEGAEILKVARQRFEEVARMHPDFPKPVAELARGKVYTRDSIEAFNKRWERKRTGRPPKASA